MQNHYYVLERDRAPHGVEVILPHPDAPQLLKPDSMPPDSSPVYQRVKELPAVMKAEATRNVRHDAPCFSSQNCPPPVPPPVYHEIAESSIIGTAQEWNLPSTVVRTVV